MKFFSSVLVSALVASSEAINIKYKQSGSRVDRSQQIKKPPRQHGNAIVRKFKDKDEVSFKISCKDSARVVFASDNENLDYSIAEPGKSSFKKLNKMMEEGNPGVLKRKDKINDADVDASAIKLKLLDGGEIKVKAETTKQNGNKDARSLSESNTVAILNPGSPLNVCYETASMTNYVGEQLNLKIALCETDSGVVQNDGSDGVLSGTVEVSRADHGGSVNTIAITSSGDDGWSLVSFTPDTAGMYSIVIDIDASSEGETFERQASGIIAVSEKQLDSVDTVSLGMDAGDSAHLAVKVLLADGYSPEDDTFIISADIVDHNNQPIMTASAIADLEADNTLRVVIQPDWFEGFGSSDYSIEYLRISTIDSVPLIIAENIPVDTTTDLFHRNRRLSETPEERELRMTQGVPPPRSQTANHGNLRRQLQSNKIIASHGYCSGRTWSDDSGNDYLPGSYKFEDLDQNRSHQKFAQLLDAYGDSITGTYEGCSIIAHSQGGAAALFLYTYYWSCLDYSTSSRLIQTVGTPFQGTVLAGNLAALGDVFGAGCGENYDLTYAGASNFLNGIPSWARSKVHYYTTSFTDKWWRYDYCHLATDVLLSDPDDGTTEKAYGQLSGANNRGHKTGWCHTTGMRDTSQTRDMSRNSDMLSHAA